MHDDDPTLAEIKEMQDRVVSALCAAMSDDYRAAREVLVGSDAGRVVEILLRLCTGIARRTIGREGFVTALTEWLHTVREMKTLDELRAYHDLDDPFGGTGEH